MNTKIIRQWVEALRSGNYKQGKRLLRSLDNEFCCLGVLCDITKDELGIDWVKETDSFDDEEVYYFDGSRGFLPNSVIDLVGFISERPVFKNTEVAISSTNSKLPSLVAEELNSNVTYLTRLNDIFRLNFNQIADIIEEEFLSNNVDN